MPRLIEGPITIQAAGNKPKEIREYIGRINSADEALSIAHMISPSGWVEPRQTPRFAEYSVVLEGMLRVEDESGATDVHAGMAVVAEPGQWVRYSTPGPVGASYIAVCLPAFSPDTLHRDEDG
jgi:mannose-6-phosphate isomerase-like protein (cupin superfamily)